MDINKDGVLVDPDFHDGNLTGMQIVGKALQLHLTTIDKRNFIVTVPNIIRMKADNFLKGNIVFDLSIYDHANCSEAKLKSLYGYDEEEAQKYLPKQMTEIADQKLTLFELGSSYGCELLALFSGSMQIEPELEN